MECKPFKIKENLFDSGLLAPKVGEIFCFEKIINYEAEIEKIARKENYNLVCFSSPSTEDLQRFKYKGTLISLEIEIQNFKENIQKLPDKYELKDFLIENWDYIENSIPHLWGSRFSNDENITFKNYQKHKLKLIKHYFQNYPSIFKVRETKEGYDAFLFSYLKNEDLVYYEGFITENYRTGLLGTSLLKQTVNEGIKKGAQRVKTNVYSDNIRFLKTYKGLGFKETGEKHFYHLWP